MTLSDFDWSSPPLSQEDEELISTYQQIGVPVDALPYTQEFDELLKRLGEPATDEAKRTTFRRLLTLRKRGLLPRA